MGERMIVFNVRACTRYRWDPNAYCPCRSPQRGPHECGRPAGHKGVCVCAVCGTVGIWTDSSGGAP